MVKVYIYCPRQQAPLALSVVFRMSHVAVILGPLVTVTHDCTVRACCC